MEEFEEYADELADSREEPEEFKLWVETKKSELEVKKITNKYLKAIKKNNKTESDNKEIKDISTKLNEALNKLFDLRLKEEKMELTELKN